MENKNENTVVTPEVTTTQTENNTVVQKDVPSKKTE